MAELIGSSDKDGAIEMFEKALKKYKYSKKVWSAYIWFRLQSGDFNEAKSLLSRSLLSLSRHKHCEVIQRYALGEFEVGSPDRARVVFESLLSSYPQRIDLWHVYIDKEIKLRDFDKARGLFDRLITLKTTSHNLKNIFKKYLNFEMNFGNATSQDLVKQKAREYVASILHTN